MSGRYRPPAHVSHTQRGLRPDQIGKAPRQPQVRLSRLRPEQRSQLARGMQRERPELFELMKEEPFQQLRQAFGATVVLDEDTFFDLMKAGDDGA